jgi:formate hydrogenlyase subunit 6/NADH:ubiquinone oxidoreductase subunit I
MDYVFTNKGSCAGCGACYHICPAHAIIMKPDEEGFLYPDINQHLCVNCAMCTEVCPITKAGNTKETTFPKVYAVKHKSDEIRITSTSGGGVAQLSWKTI